MMGFTRCASTSCFTQAGEYIAGIPVCPEHREALREIFTPPSTPQPEPPAPPPTTSLIDPALEPLDLETVIRLQREGRAGGARITSRTKLSPLQGSVDPSTAMDLGCVYYVVFRRNPEMVKIGTTMKASTRFRTLCSQSGDRLRLLVAEPGGREQEAYRHRQFAGLRLRGTEYFQYTEQIVDHIAELREQYPFYRKFTNVGRLYD